MSPAPATTTTTRLSELVTAPTEPAAIARRPEVVAAPLVVTETPGANLQPGPHFVSSTEAVPHASGRSPHMGELAGAVAAAQGEILLAIANEQGKSKGKNSGVEFTFDYADLGALIDVCNGPLSKNHIARFQPAKVIGGNRVSVTTLLVHASGQWIAETLEMPIEQGVLTVAQAVGSAISYARRYGLSSVLSLGVGKGEDIDSGRHLSSNGNGQQARTGGPVQMPQRATQAASPHTAASSPALARPLAPTPAPASQASAGSGLTVQAIEKRQRQNKPAGQFWWAVLFSNGTKASTTHAELGEALERAKRDGTVYSDVVLTKKGDFTYIEELIKQTGEDRW